MDQQLTGWHLSVLLGVGALALLAAPGCAECPNANPIRTTIRVHAPHAELVPRYCLSEREDSCREADHVSGLTYSFAFEQRAEGRLWCSYPDPPGEFRTQSCDPIEVALPQPTQTVGPSEEREVDLRAEGCAVAALPAALVGDRCEVLTRPSGLPVDSCGDPLFCRAGDSRCAALPEDCATDGDCLGVEVCDETRLCVRFACDTDESRCVWPDECLDTSDCQRSHSRCDPVTNRCHTFTCETGRCVGVAP